jgi:hypothetical protein
VSASAHEQTVLEEFELLREHLPPRLHLVVDELAHEHVTLMRLATRAPTGTKRSDDDAGDRTTK